jgi:pimeloyl-ACP methyl ester carboxylesterase
VDSVRVLVNSLGGRIALELARRARTLSVIAIAPSGLNVARAMYRSAAMRTFRLLVSILYPAIGSLARVSRWPRRAPHRPLVTTTAGHGSGGLRAAEGIQRVRGFPRQGTVEAISSG